MESDTPITHIHTAHTPAHTTNTHTYTTHTQHTHIHRHTQISCDMSQATPAQDSRKRVRFNEGEMTNIMSQNQIPSKKANEVLKEAVVALLPAIRTLVEFFFEKVLKLRITILHLNNKLERLQASTTIPKSARTNFKLSGKYKESDARTALERTVEECKTTYQNNLKTSILTSMELDLASLKTDLRTQLCEAIYQISYMFAIKQSNSDNIPTDMLHKQILRMIRTNTTIIQYGFDNFTEFQTFYKNKYSVEDNTNDDTDMTTATDISALSEGEEASISFARFIGDAPRRRSRTVVTDTTEVERPTDPLNPDSTRTLQTVLTNILSRSWTVYKHEHDVRMLNIILNKHSQTFMTTNSTDATAAVVNSEPSVDPILLKDIIASEVNKATKNLKKQLDSLKQFQQRSKNEKRGESPSKRAEKKKSQQTHKSNKNVEKKETTKKVKKSTTPQQRTSKKKPPSKSKKSIKKEEQAEGKERVSRKGKKGLKKTQQNASKSKKRNSTRK
jgi:hypothetical protein